MLHTRSMPSRYFTPQEANELVPTIRAYLLAIHDHTRALLRLSRDWDTAADEAAREEIARQRSTREVGQAHLLTRIEDLGAELMDPLEIGRVRFPAMRNGEPVWLLWNLGETKIENWTPMGTQIFGARPVSGGPSRVRWEWRN